MKYYLGVDGGGTKTEFVWVNEGGMVVSRLFKGSSNPNDIGKDKMIADMVCAVSEDMPLDADVVDVCMGLSGLGFSGCKDELIESLKKIDKVGVVDVCSDVQIALDSAYDKDGCIVIMGTGSVGYFRKNGKCQLVGGCGYMIDSSLSGYDLGREVIYAVCSEYNGGGRKTLLSELVFEKTGLHINEIVKQVYLQGKSYVASFAPCLFAAYDQGDKVAKSLLAKRVKEWERLLLGTYTLYGEKKCEITLFGGLTKRWETISKLLSWRVKRKIKFKLPAYPVVYGAMKRLKGTEDKQFLENFLASYGQ